MPNAFCEQHNIIMQWPGLRGPSKTWPKAEPEQVGDILFDAGVVNIIIKWTNVKISKYREKHSDINRCESKDTNTAEIKSFFGLLLYSAVFKSNHEHADCLLTTDGTG